MLGITSSIHIARVHICPLSHNYISEHDTMSQIIGSPTPRYKLILYSTTLMAEKNAPRAELW